MLNKHKLFLLCAKWIPVVTAIGILVTNTIAYYVRRVAEHADFNLFRRTCRMITGELVLPNTPTVTGYPSYNPCRVDNSTSTPAA